MKVYVIKKIILDDSKHGIYPMTQNMCNIYSTILISELNKENLILIKYHIKIST